MAKYYGNREIEDIKDTAETGFKEVVFKGGKTEVLSEKSIGAVVTDEPVDPTAQRDLEGQAVVGELLKVLHEWNVKVSDVDYIVNKMVESLNYSMDKAAEMLWGQNKYSRRFHDVHNVLVKNSKVLEDSVKEDLATKSPLQPEDLGKKE